MVLMFRNLAGIKTIVSLAIKHQQTYQDSLFIIGGKEGSGKSKVAEAFVYDWERKTGQKLSIDHCTFSLKEFKEMRKKMSSKSLLWLDEGKELMRANYANSDVKDFEQMMTKTRIDSNVYLICITNPLRAIRYVAEDKLVAVFYVSKRKSVKVYSGSQIYNLLTTREKDKSIHKLRLGKPLFIDTINHVEGHLSEDYKVKEAVEKNKAKTEYEEIKEINDKVEKDEYISLRETARILGIHLNTARAMADRGDLVCMKTITGFRKPLKSHVLALKEKSESTKVSFVNLKSTVALSHEKNDVF